MVGGLGVNVDGIYSYYLPVTVTSSAVACLARDASSYKIYKSVFTYSVNG